MNFMPNDLQNILFKKAVFGGYNTYQVEDVITKIVEDLSELLKDNSKLKERHEDQQEKLKYYRSIEQTLQNSLVVAQQTAEEIVANARKTAENITREAELEARKGIEDANADVRNITIEYERLRREVEAYKIRIESLLKAQLRSLENFEEFGRVSDRTAAERISADRTSADKTA